MSGVWIVEQPGSSVLEYFPPVRYLTNGLIHYAGLTGEINTALKVGRQCEQEKLNLAAKARIRRMIQIHPKRKDLNAPAALREKWNESPAAKNAGVAIPEGSFDRLVEMEKRVAAAGSAKQAERAPAALSEAETQAACSKAVESARNFVRDVGPTAAAKSSGLLEFSRIDLANAERGVHRCLSKKKLILPVPLTPIADNNEDVVGLELKHWAELILKRNCWHMLAGLMSPHRDREKAIWKEFRARYKQFEPEHEIFALEASGQLLLKADQSETEEKVELTTEVRERCMDLISKLPKDQSGCVTSLGSLFHKEGQCKPCAYWFKGQCKNGICCHNCHLVHQGQRPKRLRPGKTQKSGAGEMNLPEDEMPQSIWKKAMAERAIPSAPGPVGKQSIDVKVTTSALRQVCKEMGFQVAEAMVTTRLSL
ncbi:Uncharacterized protein SCF082_LOCUS34773 [Durusdinium trenchii]|uniref:C3H1-type domain-containing protein n=1 Tax=Durusdinium trenchii TaxID=1381693 RepID=A0ABP0P0X6_9DINO